MLSPALLHVDLGQKFTNCNHLSDQSVVSKRNDHPSQTSMFTTNLSIARISFIAFVGMLSGVVSATAQESHVFEQDGIIYRESRNTVRQPIVDEQWEERDETSYRASYTTELTEVERPTYVPTTTYTWQPRWSGTWNPFSLPKLQYKWVPVVQWHVQTRRTTVPVTEETWHEKVRTVRVPVKHLRFVERENVTRIALGPAGSLNAPVDSQPTWVARKSVRNETTDVTR